ncbi:MAG: molybdate ABC transporter substrate-binding protein [bacterium]|nr:molybdate ABC transporter substrate-binding protein [bacterium]
MVHLTSRVAALLLLALASCGGGGGGKKHIKVFAAASLRDALTELARDYQERTGTEPILNLGSSGLLAVQIERGGRADLFLSAGEREVERLITAELALADTRVDLLSNQLVVIVPTGGRKLTSAADLDGPWLERLSIANPDGVPAGRYAKAWLEDTGLWEGVKERLLPGLDVRAALAAVEHGGADAGIVYRTDAALSSDVEVAFEVPIEEGPRILYPAVVPSGRPRIHKAQRFLDFLREPSSASVFERYGFVVHQPK